MKIALIGCTKQKRNLRSRAIDLYDVSSYFLKRRDYALKVLKADHIYILSALYHLLPSEMEVEPYNLSLKNFSSKERMNWAGEVLEQIKTQVHIKDDIYILAGEKYSSDLYPLLIDAGYKVILVLEGKGGIGQQMKWLDKEVAKVH